MVSQCPFCKHINPASAKFCSDCGSPLHLKPCPKCEAVNDWAATNCHSCGDEFARTTEAIVPHAAPAHDDIATRPLATDAAAGRHHPPLYELAAQKPGALTRASGNDLLNPRNRRLEVVALPSPTVVDAVEQSSTSRLALLGIVVTGVAASGYYAYSHPSQMRQWFSMQQLKATAPIDTKLERAVTSAISTTGVSPVVRGRINSAPDDTNGETAPPPSETKSQRPPERAAGAAAEGTQRSIAPSSASANVAAQTRATTRSAGRRISLRLPSSSRSAAASAVSPATRVPESATRSNAPSSICTEAVAALGLCNRGAPERP